MVRRQQAADRATPEVAAGWLNTRRLYPSLGYVAPAEFEQAHYATLAREPHPAKERRKPRGALS